MTLLEALVVVAISVLISAIAFPTIRAAGPRADLARATTEVVAELSATRARAIASGRAAVVRPGGERPATITLTLAPNDPIAFYPDGTATRAQITLATPGRRRVIAVAPSTGAIVLR